MHEEQKTVFISYRRKVAWQITRAVFQDLRANGYDVFMDIESIDAGQFEQIIFNQIEARAHFLVILMPGTVERYDNANDMMRREIEFALEKKRNIVPLLVNDFSFEEANPYLTGHLRSLSTYNGVVVTHDYFEAAMERIRTRFLKQPVSGAIKLTPSSEKVIVQRKIEEVAARPAPTQNQLNAEEYFSRAYLKDKARDYDSAIASYSEAIRLNPQFAAAYHNRGIINGNRGNKDGAVADFTEAIRIDPLFIESYFARGYTYSTTGNLDGAIADYTEAIHIDPQDAGAYASRASVRKDKGDPDGAIADYTESIRLDPQKASAYYFRGRVYEAKGDLREALDDFQNYLSLEEETNILNGVSKIIASEAIPILQAQLKSKS